VPVFQCHPGQHRREADCKRPRHRLNSKPHEDQVEQVTGIQAFALVRRGTTPPASLSIYLANASLPAQGGTPPTPPSNPGTQVSLKPDTLYGTGTLWGAMPGPSAQGSVPRLWWLSIAQSDLSAVLDSVEDFFLLVQYKVT
jgi:hypothetical protein